MLFRSVIIPVPLPLRARDLREHRRALLYPAGIEPGLREPRGELAERAQARRAGEARGVLHALLRVLRDELLLERDFRVGGFALVLRVELKVEVEAEARAVKLV